VVEWGYNARLDNLQAAVLLFKLSSYDEEIKRRREIAGIYSSRLRHIDDLLLPPAPEENGDHFDIYQNYEVESEQRDPLRAYLSDHGVQTILQWGGRCIHQFPRLGLRADAVYTEQMTKRFFLLPMNTSLTDDDIHYICDVVESFYGLKRKVN
jgi:dTDP-4-amino-4,6-dideoxygalactose transaminase